MKNLLASVLLLVTLAACTQAQSPSNIYPVEEARADEGWTRLERIISTGEAVTFEVPSAWMPVGLSDKDNLIVNASQTGGATVIRFEVRP